MFSLLEGGMLSLAGSPTPPLSSPWFEPLFRRLCVSGELLPAIFIQTRSAMEVGNLSTSSLRLTIGAMARKGVYHLLSLNPSTSSLRLTIGAMARKGCTTLYHSTRVFFYKLTATYTDSSHLHLTDVPTYGPRNHGNAQKIRTSHKPRVLLTRPVPSVIDASSAFSSLPRRELWSLGLLLLINTYRFCGTSLGAIFPTWTMLSTRHDSS